MRALWAEDWPVVPIHDGLLVPTGWLAAPDDAWRGYCWLHCHLDKVHGALDHWHDCDLPENGGEQTSDYTRDHGDREGAPKHLQRTNRGKAIDRRLSICSWKPWAAGDAKSGLAFPSRL
jgi:hypothetical protein